MANNSSLLINIILFMMSIYQSIATLFTDLLFEHNTMEDFNGETMSIGWIQFASCEEGCSGSSSQCDNDDHSLIYPDEWTKQQMFELAKSAITVKILSSTDIPGDETTEYAVTADVCSNPIYALNNGYELSFTLDLSTSLITGFTDLNYWIGSSNAKNRMANSYYNYGRSLGTAPLLISDNEFYFAGGNSQGLHIQIGDSRGITCQYDWSVLAGHDITIWIGFDSSKTKICELISPLNYALSTATAAPTDQPSDSPTNHPSSAPSNTVTTLPTEGPSEFPSTAEPSSNPSASPFTAPQSSNPTASPFTAPPSLAPTQLLKEGAVSDETTAVIVTESVDDAYAGDLTNVFLAGSSALMFLLICLLLCIVIIVIKRRKKKDNEAEEARDIQKGCEMNEVVAVEDEGNKQHILFNSNDVFIYVCVNVNN